jgi:hypothetical protein
MKEVCTYCTLLLCKLEIFFALMLGIGVAVKLIIEKDLLMLQAVQGLCSISSVHCALFQEVCICDFL